MKYRDFLTHSSSPFRDNRRTNAVRMRVEHIRENETQRGKVPAIARAIMVKSLHLPPKTTKSNRCGTGTTAFHNKPHAATPQMRSTDAAATVLKAPRNLPPSLISLLLSSQDTVHIHPFKPARFAALRRHWKNGTFIKHIHLRADSLELAGLRRKSWTVPYAASPRLRRYCAGLM